MSKPKTVTALAGLVFLFMVASSVRADAVHGPQRWEELSQIDVHSLALPDIFRLETETLVSEQFAGNNGKHLGFSVAAFHGGLKFGLINPHEPTTASQNPEPTTLILLGSGLAAAGIARRRRKDRP